MPTVRPRGLPQVVESLETRTHFAFAADAFPKTFGGAGFDSVQKILPTSDGGYVAAGLFSGTTSFATPGTGTATARGDTDIFVARYNASGALQWLQTMGGDATDRALEKYGRRDIPINPRRIPEHLGKVGSDPRGAAEYINDLAIDAAGNVYLAGAFRQTITVGGMTLSADETFDKDFYDALVVKISDSGTVAWARQFGGAFDDDALSIALDADGTPIIGGYYSRSADFDPSSRTRILSSDGRNAGFVARLTTEGGLAWAYQFTSEAIAGVERNAANDIAVASDGSIYFAGTFGETVDFDPTFAKYEYDSEGRTDAFLGHLTRKGAFEWAVPFGGEEEDGINNIALDAEGNVYTAGYFSDEVDVDPRRNVTRIYTATPEEAGDSPEFTDILVSKWAPDGTPIWQAQMGGGYYETVSDLTIADDGSVYTVGSFFNDADFAPGRSQVILSSTPTLNGESIRDKNTRFGRRESYDWYVSRLSPRGKFVDAARFGGQDDDFGASLAVTTGGQLLVGGRATTARGDRDDRQEQSLIYLLNEDLEIV